MSRFILDFKVVDEQTLYDAAFKHAVEVDGLSPQAAQELLMAGGQIEQDACVQMLLDPGHAPGLAIHSSEVELAEDEHLVEQDGLTERLQG